MDYWVETGPGPLGHWASRAKCQWKRHKTITKHPPRDAKWPQMTSGCLVSLDLVRRPLTCLCPGACCVILCPWLVIYSLMNSVWQYTAWGLGKMKRFGHASRNAFSLVKERTLSNGLNDFLDNLWRLRVRWSWMMTCSQDWLNWEGGLERDEGDLRAQGWMRLWMSMLPTVLDEEEGACIEGIYNERIRSGSRQILSTWFSYNH